MSRFRTVFERFWRAHPQLRRQYTIDFGSLRTRVISQGQIIFDEPSCVAVDQRAQRVIAIGQTALSFLGKTPPHVAVVFPIRFSQVTEVELMSAYVQSMLQQIDQKLGGSKFLPVIHREVQLIVPAALSAVQATAWRKIFLPHSARLIFTPKAQVLLQRLSNDKRTKQLLFAIDIGAMTTEVAVFSERRVIASQTLRFGGEQFTHIITQQLRQHHHCEVGWVTAERMKQQILTLDRSSNESFGRTVIRGRDILSGLPVTLTVSAEIFVEPARALCKEWFDEVREFCQGIQPEVLSVALEQGVFLTGGSSKIRGLSGFIAESLKTEVFM